MMGILVTEPLPPEDFRVKYVDGRFATGMLKLTGATHSEIIELIIVQAMESFGIDPAVIYAYETTLLWITDNNLKDSLGRSNFSQRQLDAWEKAQVQYYLRQKAIHDS